jgi:glycosyltransferase involved in cell wall biosynthesis
VKVIVPIIRSGSGNDVYFQELKQALHDSHITLDLVRLAPYLEFAPYIAKATLLRRGEVGDCIVVHTNADYGVMFKVPTKPYVVTVHHNVFDENYQRSTSFAQRAYHYGLLKRRVAQALRDADKVVAVSYSTKASLERTFRATRIDVIHNGVDTNTFQPKQVPVPDEFANRVRLLFVGNLTRRKGADLLPEIMRRLGRDYVLFYTTGFRPREVFDKPNMISLGVSSREDLVEIYNFCDIFLFPSRLEGFGYAVAEAMACGKPVVCTNCSSLPELVVDQEGGFLCKAENAEDFAEKIQALGGNPELRESMGKFNRQRILDHFTLAKTAHNYLRLYEDVLSDSLT